MVKVLIVEDDISFSMVLESFLKRNSFGVTRVGNCKDATQEITDQKLDLFLLDYRLPDGNGLELLSLIREKNRVSPVIIMTGFNDVRTVVKAMKLGATDYITKPVNPDELMMVINQALAKQKDESPGNQNGQNNASKFIKGESEISLKLTEFIEIVAPTDLSVIIQGESGTGKEFVARSIHNASKRRLNPFIAIDCGVLSKELAAGEFFGFVKGAFTGALQNRKGQFEQASGGTLFLDEIGNLSYEVQIKLLRAIQEKVIQPLGSDRLIPVDVRFIVATNENLVKSVAAGDFREDLYHRLNEFKISVPPLRERGKDLMHFISFFIDEANRDLSRNVETLSDEVLEIFKTYEWPGNLRELKNTVKRIVLLSKGRVGQKEHLPEEMLFAHKFKDVSSDTGNLKVIYEQTEKIQIENVLDEVKGNKSRAAQILNIDRKTLYKKMDKYGFR
jgi:two-component system response regulator HydG